MAQNVDFLDPLLRVIGCLVAVGLSLFMLRNPESAQRLVNNSVSARAVRIGAVCLFAVGTVGIAATGAVYAGVIG